jgi:hypothetical protein
MEYQKKIKEKGKRLPSEEEKEGKECPNCHSINETGARFCAECGYDFSGSRKCPKCGAKVSTNADICEVCGEWLLEGICKFCYADLEEGAIYCPECGNPVAGIVCPKCGKLSYFDFCKHCNTPLTAIAKKMLEDIKNDPQEQEFLHLFESVVPQETEEISTEKEELRRMKEYIEKVEQSEKKKKTYRPLFSEKQKESIKTLGKAADEEVKRQEEERKKQEEEKQKLQALLYQMRNKTFSTNQDARRYYSAHKPIYTLGWCCNFTGTIHPCPEDCAEPWHGGYWVVDYN